MVACTSSFGPAVTAKTKTEYASEAEAWLEIVLDGNS